MSELLEWLATSRQLLERVSEVANLHVVIGNESCDLDSIVSSLCLAHFLSVTSAVSALPVLQCPKEDLPLRGDVVWLLEKVGVPLDQLVFLPEIDFSSIPELSVTLVDHNNPLDVLLPFVCDVVDHHDDQNRVSCTKDIRLVGSCATLVAERLLESPGYELKQEVATLLLGAILTDTANLSSHTTSIDEEVAARLKSLTSLDGDELFDNLKRARNTVDILGTAGLLRKDFKQPAPIGRLALQLGFSTIPRLMSALLSERRDVTQDLQEFCSSSGLHLLVLLGVANDPYRRDIALYQPPSLPECIPTDLADSVATFLESGESGLEAERILGEPFDGIILEQADVSQTRKAILPKIVAFLEAIDRESDISGSTLSPFLLPEREREDANSLAPSDSQRGSLIQLESISARLGESMDSFALAQDSETGSRNSSPLQHDLIICDDAEPRIMLETADQCYPPPPLEPTVTVLPGPPTSGDNAAVLPVDEAPAIPEYSYKEERDELRTYRSVNIGGEEKRISLKLIEPYRSIVQHGGYVGREQLAIVVLSACYLPSKSLMNYPQVMVQTFYYVLSAVEKLVVDDYVIVYLHSGSPRNSMPGIQWFHRFYRSIDRRLKKNLKHLYIVHPTFWVKTMLRLARPFISGKFYRKVHFIPSLSALEEHLTLDPSYIPQPVLTADQRLHPMAYHNNHEPSPPQEQTDSQ